MLYTSNGRHVTLNLDTHCEDGINQRIHLICSSFSNHPDDLMDSVVEGFEQQCVSVAVDFDISLSLNNVFENQGKLNRLNHMLKTAYYPFLGKDDKPFYLEKDDNGGCLFLRQWESLDRHKRNLIKWMVHFADKADKHTVLAASYPEFSLPLRMHYAWFNALQTVLNEVDGVAVVMTESPLLIQNVPCTWLPIQNGDVYTLMPSNQSFSEQWESLSNHLCGVNEQEAYWTHFLQEQFEKGMSLDDFNQKYPNISSFGKMRFKMMLAFHNK